MQLPRADADFEIDNICFGGFRQAPYDLPFQARLLPQLSKAGLLERFALLDPAAGEDAVCLAILHPFDDENLIAIDHHRGGPDPHALTLVRFRQFSHDPTGTPSGRFNHPSLGGMG